MKEERLRYLAEIGRQRSISAAAKNLYLSQASLSSTLRETEKELGFTVFERTTVGVVPTNEGEEALRLVDEINECIDQIRALGKKDPQDARRVSLIVSPSIAHGLLLLGRGLHLWGRLWGLLRLAVRVEGFRVHRRDWCRWCRCRSFFACGGCWGCTCVWPFLLCGLLNQYQRCSVFEERTTLPCCPWFPSSWELPCSPGLESAVPDLTLLATLLVFAHSQGPGEVAFDPAAGGRQPWDLPSSVVAAACRVAVVHHAIGHSSDCCA